MTKKKFKSTFKLDKTDPLTLRFKNVLTMRLSGKIRGHIDFNEDEYIWTIANMLVRAAEEYMFDGETQDDG